MPDMYNRENRMNISRVLERNMPIFRNQTGAPSNQRGKIARKSPSSAKWPISVNHSRTEARRESGRAAYMLIDRELGLANSIVRTRGICGHRRIDTDLSVPNASVHLLRGDTPELCNVHIYIHRLYRSVRLYMYVYVSALPFKADRLVHSVEIGVGLQFNVYYYFFY